MHKGKRQEFDDSLLCTKCNEIKLKTEFHKNPTKRVPYNAWCKECYNKYKAEIKEQKKYLEGSSYHEDYQYKAKLKYEYGLTLEEKDKMYVEQQGCCAICGIPESLITQGNNKRLGVDHCHRTNKVRGLLCTNCNLALGMFSDDKEILKNAILYLDKYHEN